MYSSNAYEYEQIVYKRDFLEGDTVGFLGWPKNTNLFIDFWSRASLVAE